MDQYDAETLEILITILDCYEELQDDKLCSEIAETFLDR